MTKKYHWLKHPRTRNEKRQSQYEYEDGKKIPPMCRGKRFADNIVDAWDDRPHCYQKSWKKIRKTQYHSEGRGEKHTIRIDDKNISIWQVEEYFKNHDIPYFTECIRQPYRTGQVPIRKCFVVGQKPVYRYRTVYTKDENGKILKDENGKRVYKKVLSLWYYQNVYDWITTGYKDVTYYRTLGYELSWWSNKDIGMEYILHRCKYNRGW